jgi:hypothetical protein
MGADTQVAKKSSFLSKPLVWLLTAPLLVLALIAIGCVVVVVLVILLILMFTAGVSS